MKSGGGTTRFYPQRHSQNEAARLLLIYGLSSILLQKKD